MFLAVLHLLVFLLPPALTAPCPTSFLRHFKCSFPYPVKGALCTEPAALNYACFSREVRPGLDKGIQRASISLLSVPAVLCEVAWENPNEAARRLQKFLSDKEAALPSTW